MRAPPLIWLGLALLTACTGSDPEPEPDDDDGSGSTDTADTGTPSTPGWCEEQGLTEREFSPGIDGDFDSAVPDFSWSLLSGEAWVMSEQWSGCDAYMAINYYPDSDYPVNMGQSWKIADWLEESPLNVHYFFFSYAAESDIEGELLDLQEEINDAIDQLDGDLSEHWAERIHYVTDSAWSADWVGELNSGYYVSGTYVNWSSSIDRFGYARENGSFCDPSDGWSTCPPIFMAYEAQYFNFESDRQDVLDAEADAVTVIEVFDDVGMSDSGWAGASTTVEFELPDAATMAGFDTLELDLDLRCANFPSGTECPPWDYLVYLYLCDADDPGTEEDESESCSTEFGRWITTYWRPGRWVHDMSPFLAMLQDGGTRKMRFYTQQYYDVSLSLRLSNRGKGVRPVELVELYDGGSFNNNYNWGLYHQIDDSEWRSWLIEGQEEVYAIESRDDEAQYLVAQGDEGNEEHDEEWCRFDWEWSEEGELYYCLGFSGGESADEADAAAYACVEDDPDTKEDESSCSGADHEDLDTGCNGSAWTLLESLSEENDGLNGDWRYIRHEDKLPMAFTPPASTSRVDIMAVISGHGFGDTYENCAEFCDHEHHWSIDGTEATVMDQPWVGYTYGCALQVPIGVIPNQSGTWVYGRGGWCPGQEVPSLTHEVTDMLTMGTEHEVGYLGLYDGEVYYPRYYGGSSTGSNIRLISYLVYYE